MATCVLHIFFIAPLVIGGAESERHKPPDIQGTGAMAYGEEGEESPAMILIDLSSVTDSQQPSLVEINSSGPMALEMPVHIASPDPYPAFTEAIFDETATEEPIAETSADAVGRVRLFGIYVGQVSARIERAWRRPNPIGKVQDFNCVVRIEQDREGNVLSVELMQCNGDTHWQMSLVHAIESASPLSAPPDPSVYADQLILSFSSRGS